MSKIISLLTDFGNKDGYVGVLKGVIYNICNNVNIVDLFHDIKPQNILSASWLLANNYKYFPEGTIFVCVVDPGVGSERKKIIVKSSDYFFIAPDNGLLTTILMESNLQTIVSIENKQYWLAEISNTFHGRDIFAPVAAHLANGVDILEYGPEIDLKSLIMIDTPEPEVVKNVCSGTIVHIDRFGNIITNISKNLIRTKNIKITFKNTTILGLKETYSSVKEKELLAIIGSNGYLELSCNCGKINEITNVEVGDKIFLEFLDDFRT